MALRATIYKADLQIADVDRHVYADYSLTIARHPSETDERMMARVLAYAINAQEGIAFTKGLFDVDEPDVWVKNLSGEITLWVELGQPDEARVRRACGRAEQVAILCYGPSCAVWWRQIASKLVRFGNLTVLQLPVETTHALAALAARTMHLQCMVQDGDIWMNTNTQSVHVSLIPLQSAS
ncbi:MAG: YaeQ family protein [Thiobacillaceae bacterium]